MKNIQIYNEANIKGIGVHTFANAKPVICIDDGNVFTSVLDAAEYAGVYHTTMVSHLKGKTKTCAGKHYCYLSKVSESLDAIVTRLRNASAMEEDARKWRMQEAEKAAAKEMRQKAIKNAEEKIAKHKENCEKLEAQLTQEEKCLVEAEEKLKELLADEKQVA